MGYYVAMHSTPFLTGYSLDKVHNILRQLEGKLIAPGSVKYYPEVGVIKFTTLVSNNPYGRGSNEYYGEAVLESNEGADYHLKLYALNDEALRIVTEEGRVLYRYGIEPLEGWTSDVFLADCDTLAAIISEITSPDIEKFQIPIYYFGEDNLSWMHAVKHGQVVCLENPTELLGKIISNANFAEGRTININASINDMEGLIRLEDSSSIAGRVREVHESRLQQSGISP